jgi:activator of 2-hydroxyglutaryl-CoA dehydratase
VLIDDNGEILKKVYQLSKGNPIQDTKEMFAEMRHYGPPIRARRSR